MKADIFFSATEGFGQILLLGINSGQVKILTHIG